MYDVVEDPYCYDGTAVLRNVPGLRSQKALDRFEAVATGRRFLEPMPGGRWSVRHYLAVHRHIFQDVYRWAGQLRTVRISKSGSMFCYPEHISSELRRVFAELSRENTLRHRRPEDFAAGAAHFLSELNAVHAFRDGNGRTQLAFLALLAGHAGHPLDLERLDPGSFLNAMIESFGGSEQSLMRQIAEFIADDDH